jgi:enterochelin esterase family protein
VDSPLLLVVTDGETHVERLGTPAVLARLVEDGLLPPLRAVFVDAQPERSHQLGLPGGQARWIAEDLVPGLQERGLASADPRRVVVTGSSFGGLTALFALARAPHAIGTVSAQSVSLWRFPRGALVEPLAAALRAAPRTPRIRLHGGRYEGTMAPRAAELVEAVAARTGVRIPLRLHSGGHDWAWWHPALLEDLLDAFGPGARD